MPKKTARPDINRDAKTGEFVTQEFAKDNPETTVTEKNISFDEKVLVLMDFYQKVIYHNQDVDAFKADLLEVEPMDIKNFCIQYLKGNKIL